MPYGNSAAQLPCLPAKSTTGPTGPQVIWSSVFPLVQLVLVHDCPDANLQTMNVAPDSTLCSISFVVCPEPHTGAVQEASVKLIGSVTSATTRPFFGSILWLVLVVVGVVCFFASVGQLPPPPTQAQEIHRSAAGNTKVCVAHSAHVDVDTETRGEAREVIDVEALRPGVAGQRHSRSRGRQRR
jgi:hypothetical protein